MCGSFTESGAFHLSMRTFNEFTSSMSPGTLKCKIGILNEEVHINPGLPVMSCSRMMLYVRAVTYLYNYCTRPVVFYFNYHSFLIVPIPITRV